jgi:hypothetical protein
MIEEYELILETQNDGSKRILPCKLFSRFLHEETQDHQLVYNLTESYLGPFSHYSLESGELKVIIRHCLLLINFI